MRVHRRIRTPPPLRASTDLSGARPNFLSRGGKISPPPAARSDLNMGVGHLADKGNRFLQHFT
jgi:hypothetical protein